MNKGSPEKVYEAPGYDKLLTDVGDWVRGVHEPIAVAKDPIIKNKEFPIGLFGGNDFSMKLNVGWSRSGNTDNTAAFVEFFTKNELESEIPAGMFRMKGEGGEFHMPHRYIENRDAFRRIGLGTLAFDVLENIARISGGVRIVLHLLALNIELEDGRHAPWCIQADVLSMLNNRGYNPAGSVSVDTICGIVRGEYEMAVDSTGGLKALPRDFTTAPSFRACDVVKSL